MGKDGTTTATLCPKRGTSISVTHDWCQEIQGLLAVRRREGQPYLQASHLLREAWVFYRETKYPNAAYVVDSADGETSRG